MKLSSYILTAMGLVTSVLAAPVLVERSADIEKRTPQGSFIWEWYGDVADEKEPIDSTEIEKRSTQKRAPQGSFIWEWYGDVADEKESADSTEIGKRSTKKRSPQGSFIWEWYGDVADGKESTDSTEIESID